MLASNLHSFKCLTTIDLEGNAIEAAGALFLLSEPIELKTWILRNCSIDRLSMVPNANRVFNEMKSQLEAQICRNPVLELIDIRDNIFSPSDFTEILTTLSLRTFDGCKILPSEQNIDSQTFKALRGELKPEGKGAKGKKRKRGK